MVLQVLLLSWWERSKAWSSWKIDGEIVVVVVVVFGCVFFMCCENCDFFIRFSPPRWYNHSSLSLSLFFFLFLFVSSRACSKIEFLGLPSEASAGHLYVHNSIKHCKCWLIV